MGVECKFDKNYNVTSDWSLENMTERGPSDSSRSSLLSLHRSQIPRHTLAYQVCHATHCSLRYLSLLVLLPTQP